MEWWGEPDPTKIQYCWKSIASECARMQSGADLVVLRVSAAAARQAIRQHAPLPQVREIIRRWIADTADQTTAIVRSSASSEDSGRVSSAGQYQSFTVPNTEAAIVEAYREVTAAFFGDMAVAYRDSRGVSQLGPRMGVIIQCLIRPLVSGVVFGCHPVSGDTDIVMIEAAFGFGGPILAGEITPDRIILGKADFSVRSSVLGTKSFREDVRAKGRRQRSKTTLASRRSLCLSETQIREIAIAYAEIEDLFGSPQDIEFCFARDGLWIVQARAVTATGRRAA